MVLSEREIDCFIARKQYIDKIYADMISYVLTRSVPKIIIDLKTKEMNTIYPDCVNKLIDYIKNKWNEAIINLVSEYNYANA